MNAFVRVLVVLAALAMVACGQGDCGRGPRKSVRGEARGGEAGAPPGATRPLSSATLGGASASAPVRGAPGGRFETWEQAANYVMGTIKPDVSTRLKEWRADIDSGIAHAIAKGDLALRAELQRNFAHLHIILRPVYMDVPAACEVTGKRCLWVVDARHAIDPLVMRTWAYFIVDDRTGTITVRGEFDLEETDEVSLEEWRAAGQHADAGAPR